MLLYASPEPVSFLREQEVKGALGWQHKKGQALAQKRMCAQKTAEIQAQSLWIHRTGESHGTPVLTSHRGAWHPADLVPGLVFGSIVRDASPVSYQHQSEACLPVLFSAAVSSLTQLSIELHISEISKPWRTRIFESGVQVSTLFKQSW